MTIENVKNSNCNSHNFPIPSLEILFNYEWYRDDPVTAHMMEAKECLSKWSKPALVMFSTKWDFARCWSYLAHFVGTEPNKPNIEVLTHHVPPGTPWLVGRTKSSWSWSLMQRKRWSTSFGLKREFKLVTFCLSIQLKARVGITFFSPIWSKTKNFNWSQYLQVVEGAGHFLQESHGEELADNILDFLKSQN